MDLNKELFAMEKGGIVSVYNRDYVVEQAVKLNAGSTNYLLKDGNEIKWLCVRNPGEVLAVLCDPVVLEESALGPSLEHDQVTYSLLQKGSVRAVATSAMGYPRYINVDFFDYSAGDEQRFLFAVKSGATITAMAGEAVSSAAIMVFPKPNQ